VKKTTKTRGNIERNMLNNDKKLYFLGDIYVYVFNTDILYIYHSHNVFMECK